MANKLTMAEQLAACKDSGDEQKFLKKGFPATVVGFPDGSLALKDREGEWTVKKENDVCSGDGVGRTLCRKNQVITEMAGIIYGPVSSDEDGPSTAVRHAKQILAELEKREVEELSVTGFAAAHIYAGLGPTSAKDKVQLAVDKALQILAAV